MNKKTLYLTLFNLYLLSL